MIHNHTACQVRGWLEEQQSEEHPHHIVLAELQVSWEHGIVPAELQVSFPKMERSIKRSQ